MANIIVASFKEEKKSILAIHELKELELFGDITLFAYTMLRKSESGAYEIFQDEGKEYVWRTFTGAAIGTLIGALAGPVGLTIGFITGTILGGVADNNHYDFDDNFLRKVTKNLEVGTIAIVAEVGEDSHVFIEDALQPLGAKILRTDTDIEYGSYVDAEIAEIEDKIEDARDKMKNAVKRDKAKINAKIKDLKTKRKAKIKALETQRKTQVKELRMKTENGISAMISRLNKVENSVSNSITKAKAERLKKRIKKHEGKLAKLSESLEEIIIL